MDGLLGSTALEIALGLVFIYFLLSLICSAINEFFAGLLKWRARDLENGIINLLRDPSIIKGLLSHPLVRAVGSDRNEAVLIRLLAGVLDNRDGSQPPPQEGEAGATGATGAGGATSILASDKHGVIKNYGSKPSYIPSETFVLTLLDLLSPAEGGPITVQRVREKALGWATGKDVRTGEHVQVSAGLRDLGKSLLLVIDNSSPGETVISIDDIRALVEALPDSAEKDDILKAISSLASIDQLRTLALRLPVDVRQPVLDLLNRVQTDVTAVRGRLENWYDTAMEQVRGVYKRRIQIYLFGFGILVAVIVGADTFHIANVLATNDNLRQALIGEVGRATTPGGDLYLPIQNSISSTNTITSTVVVTSTGNVTSTTTTVTLPSSAAVADTLNRYTQLFGYDEFTSQWSARGAPDNVFPTLWKALGLLVTGFALSFGAPFWFDLLNRVANLRAAIKPESDKSKK